MEPTLEECGALVILRDVANWIPMENDKYEGLWAYWTSSLMDHTALWLSWTASGYKDCLRLGSSKILQHRRLT
eukprot:1365853-Amphidinium_carterae.1